MKAVLYILRFHGFGLTVSLTVLGFGVWGLLAYMPPVSSERDVILKAPYEVLPVHFILIAFVVAGVVGLLRLVSIATHYWALFNDDSEKTIDGRS